MTRVLQQVVGVPDSRLGEQVCAWIRLKEGFDVTESSIKEFCKGKVRQLFKQRESLCFPNSVCFAKKLANIIVFEAKLVL